MKHSANIKFDGETYYALEYMAEQKGKSVTEVVNDACHQAVAEFKNETGMKKVPMTDIRKAKNKK